MCVNIRTVCRHSWSVHDQLINTQSLCCRITVWLQLHSLWCKDEITVLIIYWSYICNHAGFWRFGPNRSSSPLLCHRTVDWSKMTLLLLWCDVMGSQTCRWVCSGHSWRQAAPCWRGSEPAAGTSHVRNGTEQTVHADPHRHHVTPEEGFYWLMKQLSEHTVIKPSLQWFDL